MSARPGVVYLVGAGPGDPGLMTARALELVASADVILHDRLIPASALAGAREDAELIYVGKAAGDHAVPQDGINDLLVDRAQAGRSVVRLKGGDPFVFGRGGEEAEELAAAGVPFEVVPGVTAGVAVPAYAGIPVTHRDGASAVAFVTGHERPDRPGEAVDYEALAAFAGTLVFYMGLGRVGEIAEALTAAGRPASQPAAVISRGTEPGQRAVVATLGTIAAEVRAADLPTPALIVVGEVIDHADAIGWLDRRPLHGRTVVVTRARAQASATVAELRELGAEVVEAPAIRAESRITTDEVARAIAAIGDYGIVVLTSVNAVGFLFEALSAGDRDARALAGVEVAAIGPGTAAALAARGIEADLVAERSIAESLLDTLAERNLEGARVLIARAREAREVLPDGLRDRGAEVDVVTLYETLAEAPPADVLEAAARADYITFTSASTVHNYLDAGGPVPANARVATIGPVTSDAARGRGLDVHVEATRHDPAGLVEAIVADAASRG